MVRTAYFDCFAGASGDMLVGSLLDAGVDEAAWRTELQKLPVVDEACAVEIHQVRKQGIAATKMTVFLDGVEADAVPVDGEHAEHHCDHQRSHQHTAAAHAGAGEHATPRRREPHRGLDEIRRLLDAADISPAARHLAREVFKTLALAEGRVHGVAPEAVQFHEVGARDAIIDITGFAIGYHLLGIERAVASPFVLGRGLVHCAHGLMPVPVPAVLEMVRMAKAPVSPQVLDGECVTPTGAAILTTIASAYSATPPFTDIETIGYGAGARNHPAIPNVVRLVIGVA